MCGLGLGQYAVERNSNRRNGEEKLVLREGIRGVVQELDRRGILQSVASKNNHGDAIAVLKKFNLEEYFLYRKSAGILRAKPLLESLRS